MNGKLDDPVPAFGYADGTPRRSDGDFDILGPVPRVGFHVLDLVSIENRTCFDRFDIQRTVPVPERLQRLGQAVRFALKEVRSVESLSGSIGNVSATV